jgi:hypothetical protein
MLRYVYFGTNNLEKAMAPTCGNDSGSGLVQQERKRQPGNRGDTQPLGGTTCPRISPPG